MKTIKVIDLLNKIANGEEVPKKFRIKGSCFKDLYYEYNEKYNCYDLIGENFKYGCYVFGYSELNDEVEIIEDTPKEDKKIKKLDVALLGQCDNWLQPTIETNEKIRAELNPYIIENIRENTLLVQRKLNEIIDRLNDK